MDVVSPSATASGKITLRPKDHLTLFSDPQTINQDICINEEIIDIVYEFSGSANAMAFNQPLGLPDGVEGQYYSKTTSIRNNYWKWSNWNN